MAEQLGADQTSATRNAVNECVQSAEFRAQIYITHAQLTARDRLVCVDFTRMAKNQWLHLTPTPRSWKATEDCERKPPRVSALSAGMSAA